jgi:hypothetical protein
MVDTPGVARGRAGASDAQPLAGAVSGHRHKGKTVHNVIGMHKGDIIAAGLRASCCEYCANDGCEGSLGDAVLGAAVGVRLRLKHNTGLDTDTPILETFGKRSGWG